MVIFQVRCVDIRRRWDKWYFFWPAFIGVILGYNLLNSLYALSIIEVIGLAFALSILYRISNKEISSREYTGFKVVTEEGYLIAYRNGQEFFRLPESQIKTIYHKTILWTFKYFVIIDKEGFQYKLDVPNESTVTENNINTVNFV